MCEMMNRGAATKRTIYTFNSVMEVIKKIKTNRSVSLSIFHSLPFPFTMKLPTLQTVYTSLCEPKASSDTCTEGSLMSNKLTNRQLVRVITINESNESPSRTASRVLRQAYI